MERESKTTFVKQENAESQVEVQLTYKFKKEDFVIGTMPESCIKCPVGFSTIPGKACGRNVPFKQEDNTKRPETCKLRSIDEVLGIS